MTKIGFSYLQLPLIDTITGRVDKVYKPIIPIRLSYHHSNPTQFFDALVDSGSDRNLLPVGLGVLAGVNFKKAKKTKIIGIGNHVINAYTSQINIWVEGKEYKTEADFSPEQQVPLLGRRGFFDLFKMIQFDENKKWIDIEL